MSPWIKNRDHVRDHLLYLCRKNRCHPVELKHQYNFYGRYAKVLNQLILDEEDQ